MSDALDVVKGASGDIFGNGSKPGVLGTGQQDINGVPVDKGNFTDGYGAAQRQQDQDRLAAIDKRNAPTMDRTQLSPNERAATVSAGQSAQANAALGTATKADLGNLGPAAQMNGAQINRSEDTQSRGLQMDLAKQLADQAAGHGPGQQLAEAAFAHGNDTNIKNAMALAASQGGSVNPAIAARAAQESVAAGTQANAGALADAKAKAQLDAQQQLSGLSTNLRGQDIGVNTGQAGLDQTANINNQSANNTFGLAKFNAENNNNQFNAGQGNDMSKFNAQNQTDVSKFNSGNENDMNKFNAGLSQNNNQFNAGQTNTTNLTQGQMDEATKQANMDAYLKNQGQNDNMSQFYSQDEQQQNQADRQAMEDYQNTQVQQNLGIQGLQQKAYESARGAQSGALAGGLKMLPGLMSMSDEEQKTNIQPLAPDRSRFNQLMKGISDITANNNKDGGHGSNQKEATSGMGAALMAALAKNPGPKNTVGPGGLKRDANGVLDQTGQTANADGLMPGDRLNGVTVAKQQATPGDAVANDYGSQMHSMMNPSSPTPGQMSDQYGSDMAGMNPPDVGGPVTGGGLFSQGGGGLEGADADMDVSSDRRGKEHIRLAKALSMAGKRKWL